jgi:integrase
MAAPQAQAADDFVLGLRCVQKWSPAPFPRKRYRWSLCGRWCSGRLGIIRLDPQDLGRGLQTPTSLSILLEIGTPVNTVQRRAGHSKASVTVDVYGHAMARSQEEAAQKIEEMVAPIQVELQ